MEKKTNFKTLAPKAKVQYIWDYYRWPIVIGVICFIFVFSLVKHYVTYRDPALNVIMINCNDPYNSDNSGFDEFAETYNLDPVEQPLSIASSMYFSEDNASTAYSDLQVLSVMIAAGDQDLFLGTGSVFMDYAAEGALKDISTVVSPEVLARYEDQLIYCTDEETGIEYPCAIEITDNTWLTKYNYYSSCYFGVFNSSKNQQTVEQFADFLLNYDM